MGHKSHYRTQYKSQSAPYFEMLFTQIHLIFWGIWWWWRGEGSPAENPPYNHPNGPTRQTFTFHIHRWNMIKSNWKLGALGCSELPCPAKPHPSGLKDCFGELSAASFTTRRRVLLEHDSLSARANRRRHEEGPCSSHTLRPFTLSLSHLLRYIFLNPNVLKILGFECDRTNMFCDLPANAQGLNTSDLNTFKFECGERSSHSPITALCFVVAFFLSFFF